jgi:hypothetical protein
MLLSNLFRMIFGTRREPKAVRRKVARRIQQVCVRAAVEFERQAEVMREQRERLAAYTQDDSSAALEGAGR